MRSMFKRKRSECACIPDCHCRHHQQTASYKQCTKERYDMDVAVVFCPYGYSFRIVKENICFNTLLHFAV